MLRLGYFAILYFNLETPNRYALDNAKDREKARSNFSNLLHYDKERLKQAQQLYLSLLTEELTAFIDTCKE